MNDITYNGYHLPTLVRMANNIPQLRYDTHFTGLLWDISNHVPYDIGKALLIESGFKPFVGFPLQRTSN
jgi:hypothetical protein